MMEQGMVCFAAYIVVPLIIRIALAVLIKRHAKKHNIKRAVCLIGVALALVLGVIGVIIYFVKLKFDPEGAYKPPAPLGCPVCGTPLQYVYDYNRYYCSTCGKYEDQLQQPQYQPPYQQPPQPYQPPQAVPQTVQTFTPTPPPTPPQSAPVTIRCPSCNNMFQVPSTPRPLEVTCPKCGAKGTLK